MKGSVEEILLYTSFFIVLGEMHLKFTNGANLYAKNHAKKGRAQIKFAYRLILDAQNTKKR